MSQPTIAITMGDPAGIGPEIVARALGEPEVRAACRPVVTGDPRIMERAVQLVKSPLRVRTVQGLRGTGTDPATLDVVPAGEVDPATQSVRAEGAVPGWLQSRSIAFPVEPTAARVSDSTGIVVGIWGFGWFDSSPYRGFPENLGKKPKPGRPKRDLTVVAAIIRNLSPDLLVLEDIPVTTRGKTPFLDSLVASLPESTYRYAIGDTSGAHGIGILYDGRRLRLDAMCIPTELAEPDLAGTLWPTPPVFAHFTTTRGEATESELLIAAVRLLPGSRHASDRAKALQRLACLLNQPSVEESCLPPGEHDVLLLGDMEVTPYDSSMTARTLGTSWCLVRSTRSGNGAGEFGAEGSPPTCWMVASDSLDASLGTEGVALHTEFGKDPDAFRGLCAEHLPITLHVPLGKAGGHGNGGP